MILNTENIFSFGKSYKENKEKFPSITYINYQDNPMIFFENLNITPYLLDCGSVLFHRCCRATDANIKRAINFCSFNGFDKIFHTYTNPNQQLYDAFKDRMISLGFNYIPAGHSNRNPEYLCGIFIYYIPDCEHKGYTF